MEYSGRLLPVLSTPSLPPSDPLPLLCGLSPVIMRSPFVACGGLRIRQPWPMDNRHIFNDDILSHWLPYLQCRVSHSLCVNAGSRHFRTFMEAQGSCIQTERRKSKMSIAGKCVQWDTTVVSEMSDVEKSITCFPSYVEAKGKK